MTGIPTAITFPQTRAMWLDSQDLVLLAVAELFVPVLDNTDRQTLCFRVLHPVRRNEAAVGPGSSPLVIQTQSTAGLVRPHKAILTFWRAPAGQRQAVVLRQISAGHRRLDPCRRPSSKNVGTNFGPLDALSGPSPSDGGQR